MCSTGPSASTHASLLRSPSSSESSSGLSEGRNTCQSAGHDRIAIILADRKRRGARCKTV